MQNMSVMSVVMVVFYMLFEEVSSSGEIFHVTIALVSFCCHVFHGFIFSKNTSVEVQ